MTMLAKNWPAKVPAKHVSLPVPVFAVNSLPPCVCTWSEGDKIKGDIHS